MRFSVKILNDITINCDMDPVVARVEDVKASIGRAKAVHPSCCSLLLRGVRLDGEILLCDAGIKEDDIINCVVDPERAALRLTIRDLAGSSVAVDAIAGDTVLSLKRRALDAMRWDVDDKGVVLASRGTPLREEGVSLASAGIIDGAVLVLVKRRTLSLTLKSMAGKTHLFVCLPTLTVGEMREQLAQVCCCVVIVPCVSVGVFGDSALIPFVVFV